MVRTDQPVRMTLYSFPGEVFGGRVTKIYDKADPDRRTFEIDIALDRPGEPLAAGMTGELAFVVAEREGATVVPAQALQSGRVYTVRDGRLAAVDAQIGLKSIEPRRAALRPRRRRYGRPQPRRRPRRGQGRPHHLPPRSRRRRRLEQGEGEGNLQGRVLMGSDGATERRSDAGKDGDASIADAFHLQLRAYVPPCLRALLFPCVAPSLRPFVASPPNELVHRHPLLPLAQAASRSCASPA